MLALCRTISGTRSLRPGALLKERRWRIMVDIDDLDRFEWPKIEKSSKIRIDKKAPLPKNDAKMHD